MRRLGAGIVLLWSGLLLASPGAARAQTSAATTAPAAATDPAPSSCAICHADSNTFDAATRAIVTGFQQDVHAASGLSCADCHGGNPDPKLAGDIDKAMDRRFAANPYRGKPDRAAIPDFCGRCHSDPNFMRRFRPDVRTDQESEYWTSNHGKALRKGDTAVATCIDCHGVHGILRVGDTRAPVYPTQVAETCKRCHSDAQRMAGRARADGTPLPVDQYDRWRRSVHAQGLLEGGDLSSPTCPKCHGNHGAAPPGVESVAFVCGQCHGREATLFRASVKHEKLQDHNQLIAENKAGKCADCHNPPDPQAQVTFIRRFTECTTCHENHAILRPSVALLGNLPETPCAFCHVGPAAEATGAGDTPETRKHFQQVQADLLQQATGQGLDGKARFDWLVDQLLRLPFHTLGPAPESKQPPELRPEFKRLFEKFRIGKTSYTYFDPAQGKDVVAAVRSCDLCHGAADSTSTSVGAQTARTFLTDQAGVTVATAQAERVLLRAQRGGVNVQEGQSALDKAVGAQIELEVLVHTFASDTSGAFLKKHAEASKAADAALGAGRSDLQELKHRRTGLAASLAFVVLMLAAIAARISFTRRPGA